jgi:hypothetical protein
MRPTILFFFLSLVLGHSAFAGKSLVLTPSNQNTSSVNDPLLNSNQSWRIEFQIHDWVLPPPTNQNATVFNMYGTGAVAWIYPNNNLVLGDFRDTVSPAQPCFMDLTGRSNVLVRMQRDVANLNFVCEIWNYDGSGYASQTYPITSINAWVASGGNLGGATTSLAFLRSFSTVTPVGGKPPVTADHGDLLELKFDGNLNDSSGHNHSPSVPGATYVNTPNQIPIAFPKTFGTPSWTNWVSFRAGHPAKLDGTASYSLADSSSAVSYLWQLVNGPSQVIWSNRQAAVPTVTGLVFGTYTFSLTVTDQAGSTATTSLQVGAVAYDDHGIVIQSNPNITKIFGPMIAFGQNPWGYADERAKTAVILQNAYFLANHNDQPTWETPGQGTVSYPFAGKGPPPGPSCTQLSASITSTSTSIPVANASCLSLASLPTWILIGNFIGSQELVRICSTTATSGPATLTACYDGRGLASYPFGSAGVAAAGAWPSGTIVGEMRVSGTGTLFASDPNRPLCPAGLPGPPGPVTYSTGTVNLAGSSMTVTGTGTNWVVSGSVSPTFMIRVSATHGGGIPFIWWAQITTVVDTTHITASRPAPPDVDPGPFSYQITGGRYLSLEFQPGDGSTARTLQNLMGCESETAAFATAAHDLPNFDTLTFSGVHYSYKDGLGMGSIFGPNFYGSGLAMRAFYIRSGWTFAKQTADIMDEQWVKDPEICSGWCGGLPLTQGGGFVGAIADLVTNPTTNLTWSDVRRFGVTGSIGAAGCNDWDTRDSGILEAFVALLTLFDPDPTQNSNWMTALAALYNRDLNCKHADNSWGNAFYFNTSAPIVNVTNGSPIATSPNNSFTPAVCNGLSSGTAMARKGSPLLTNVTGTVVPGDQIVVTGINGGLRFTRWTQFESTGTSLTLSGLWTGDSGPVTWLTTATVNWGAIGVDSNDPMMHETWSCTYNSPSQITLHRAWDGPTNNSGTDHYYLFNFGGYGQQPFMLGGYKESAMKWASQVADPTMASNFHALTILDANWIRQFGWDPEAQGIANARLFQACEPYTTSSSFLDNWKASSCLFGANPASQRASRVLTAETSQALRVYMESQNYSPAARTFGDTAYGSIWGYCPYTQPGYYCDSNYVRDENSNISLSAYKWPGFFFGIGMSHMWPAVRNGVPESARPRNISVDFNLRQAASANIILTAPNGAITTFACSSAPCTISVDDRQGTYWRTIQYLSATGSVVAQSDPELLAPVP